MISCGEASGDLYAGALAGEIRRRDPSLSLWGFGGAHLREAGAEVLEDYHAFSVTGLTEAVRVLPRSYRLLRRLVDEARRRRPRALVVVDFPDFHFRLAAAVHALGIPVVYYVGPQFWAWRPGRLQAMRKFVAKALVIFPFEAALYRDAGVPVEFVGHPLIDLVGGHRSRADVLTSQGLVPSRPTVALLPGSRPNEVRAILPTILEAADRLRQSLPPVQFLLARAPGLDPGLFAGLDAAEVNGLRVGTLTGMTDDVLSASDVVITASGTATVQAALHERPMVIVYRLSPLTYRLGKPFVRVETYGMVNLVAGRRVVPELIQEQLTPGSLHAATLAFLTDERLAKDTTAALREVRERLGSPGASGRAADAVLATAGRVDRPDAMTGSDGRERSPSPFRAG